MGTIRTILAISVVLGHSYGYVFVGGRLAVQMFYIISGFLISYILIELKSYSNVKTFYLNRFLRLFPLYYFISILTLIFFIFMSYSQEVLFFETFKKIDLIGKLYLIFSNIFILGQDIAFFSSVENGKMVFAIDYNKSDVIVYQGLISQVTWTLSLEILFYLIAPFIVPRTTLLLFILFGSIILRTILIYIGVGLAGAFTYRFFPLEIALFILGALSHQVIKPVYQYYLPTHLDQISVISTFLLIIFCITFHLLPIFESTFIMIATLLLILPLLLHFQQLHQWDAQIGKYSYPIYVCHYFVLVCMEYVNFNDIFTKTVVILVSTFILAFLSEKLIIMPFEKLRIKNKKIS